MIGTRQGTQLQLYKTVALPALLHESETSRVTRTKGIRIDNKWGEARQLAATLGYVSIMGSTTKVFSCWPLTLEVRVWSQPSPCGIMCWTKWHWDNRFFSDYIGFPWSLTFHNQPFITIPYGPNLNLLQPPQITHKHSHRI